MFMDLYADTHHLRYINLQRQTEPTHTLAHTPSREDELSPAARSCETHKQYSPPKVRH